MAARAVLRKFAHKWWAKHLTNEAMQVLRKNGHHPKDARATEDCLQCAEGADYWEWHRGSRLFFWRFPKACGWQRDARDGVEFWHLANPPTGRHFANIPATTREGELQIRAKVLQLVFRWYLEKGPLDLVIPTFPVEKVVDENSTMVLDIRAVWDAKRNGLNATLWCPKFCLPTTRDAEDLVVKWLSVPVGSYLRGGLPPQDYTQDPGLMIKSWQFDPDVAQMFNNFLMHLKERHSHGVRFFHTRNNGSIEAQSFFRWCVLNFGCMCSPYIACQGEERIMEMCMGDPEDDMNLFQYHEVWLNLPGAKNYDPSMPRLIFLTKEGEMATRKVTFVDDIHGAARGSSDAPAREAYRILACLMNYFANQAAARKVGPPTLIPRPWNGVMTHTDSPHPVKGTTAKKWNRGRRGLAWVWEQCGLADGVTNPGGYIDNLPSWDIQLDTAEIRRIAGLWVHITETYTEGRCFLKGFFNALEGFRADRDIGGWRLLDAMESVKELEIQDSLFTWIFLKPLTEMGRIIL